MGTQFTCPQCGSKTYRQEYLAGIPIARTSDPETSHEAATEITASGKRQTNCDKMLDLVRRFQGSTSGELGERITMNGHWKRLSDLIKQGKILTGKPRKYQGHYQNTYYLNGP
jgi:hypothetical protein